MRRRKADQRGRIADAVSISERPASVEDRAVPGHWEGDLLCGSKNSYIVTLVERHSRYVMLAKVPNRETQTVVDALDPAGAEAARRTLQIPDLGSRQGTRRPQAVHDGNRYRRLFLRPAKPLAARLKRKHQPPVAPVLPRGIDLAPHSQAELNKVARQLNERPRKTLDFQSPAERFSQCVAATG